MALISSRAESWRLTLSAVLATWVWELQLWAPWHAGRWIMLLETEGWILCFEFQILLQHLLSVCSGIWTPFGEEPLVYQALLIVVLYCWNLYTRHRCICACMPCQSFHSILNVMRIIITLIYVFKSKCFLGLFPQPSVTTLCMCT